MRICTSCHVLRKFQCFVPGVRHYAPYWPEMGRTVRIAAASYRPQQAPAHNTYQNIRGCGATDSCAPCRQSRLGCQDNPHSAVQRRAYKSSLRQDGQQHSEQIWLYQSGRILETAAFHPLRKSAMQHDVADGFQGRVPNGRQ